VADQPGHRDVHIIDDVPELRGREVGPILVVCLDGFLDAGRAAVTATEHLLANSESRVVASLDVDSFYDYRSRRPPLSFVEDHYESYEAPRLVVRLATAADGAPFLLLHGPEPDLRWEAFALAVRHVVEHFGVRLTVQMGAVPMAVPHTRPAHLTHHATDKELILAENVWSGELRVPASAQSLLEIRMGEWGHRAMGFVAHVPHYLAQTEDKTAALRLVEALQVISGLRWDNDSLAQAAINNRVEIDEQVAQSEELSQLVKGLEDQYDAFHEARTGEATNLLAEDTPLPTGEELGSEFERFLAGLEDGDD